MLVEHGLPDVIVRDMVEDDEGHHRVTIASDSQAISRVSKGRFTSVEYSGSSALAQREDSHAPVLLVCQGRLVLEGGVDGAGEVALEAAEGFAAALPVGLFPFHVGACGWVYPGLGDRDSVKGPVELAGDAARTDAQAE